MSISTARYACDTYMGLPFIELRYDQAVYKVPQQPNTTDCGLYVIAFAECLCKGGDPSSHNFHINAQDIPDLRYRIIV